MIPHRDEPLAGEMLFQTACYASNDDSDDVRSYSIIPLHRTDVHHQESAAILDGSRQREKLAVSPLRVKTTIGGRPRGSNRVNRGGSWNNTSQNCRAANRNRNTPSKRNNNLGFRVSSPGNGWMSGIDGTGRFPFRRDETRTASRRE